VHCDLAVVTSDAAATRRAEIFLQDLWAGRETAQFALGLDALALAPGDVIALTANDRRRLFEIDELVDTDARQLKARSIDPEVFALPLQAPRRVPVQIPPALGPVQAMPMDLPSIDPSVPAILTRLAVFANPWPGSVVIWSSADGSSYQAIAVAPVRAIVGETLDPLPAGPTALWDRGNAFRVRLYGGALSSLPDAGVLAGGNAAALQNASGGWEILQFANAELVDGNTYLLSRLLRGQAGSDDAMSHPLPAGAPFVLLDSHLVPLARGLDALGRAMQLRLVAAGRSHDDPSAVALSVTPGATALRPLSPVHVAAIRKPDGIHVSWIRRTRIDGDGWGVEVPLGEETEAYQLEILSGGAVIRSLVCTAPTAIYTGADELSDFGAPQSRLHLRVAQLSSTVGAGRPTELTLTI
jgi:hypothetical protein